MLYTNHLETVYLTSKVCHFYDFLTEQFYIETRAFVATVAPSGDLQEAEGLGGGATDTAARYLPIVSKGNLREPRQ